MAKATQTPAGPSAPVMVNKGLPWMFILGMSAVLLLAVFGLWSGFSGASGSFLPAFSIFWLLGVALLAYAGWTFYKFKIVRGIILVLLALVAFKIPGTISGPKLEKGLLAAPGYVAEKGSNLLVTGTTKSPADIAAARKAEAAQRAIEAEAEKQRRIADAVAQAAAEAEAAKYRPLTKDAFITKTIGKFEPIVIQSGQRIGPIYLYQGTCPYWYKSGMGRVRILSRPDETSKPVEAKMNPSGYGVASWGHEGEAFDLFFEAYEGDVKIELERREGDHSCS